MKLRVKLPDQPENYDPRRIRELVRTLETTLARVEVDSTIGAYTATGNFTLSASDDVVLVDTSGGDVTVTLPEISDEMVRHKQEFEVVKTTTAGTLTILPTGTDTILGEPDAVVTVQWTALRFRATTGNWVVV